MKHIIGIDFGTSTSMIKTAIRDDNADSLETKPVTYTQQGIGSTPTLIRRLGDIVWYGFEAEQNERQDAPLIRNFKLGLRSENPEARKQAIVYIEEFYAYLYEQYQEQKSFLFGTASGEEETWVSYPVQWSEEQRRVVLDAARKAGFPNVKGLDEPTAAVICILKAKQKELEKSGLLCRETPLNAMVLDMGAGTTDLAFITVTIDGQGLHTTLRGIWPEAGSPYIYGGGQMDARLEEMLEEWVKGCGISTAKNMVAGQRCAIKRWKENTVSPLLAQGQTISDFSGISTILNTMALMMGLAAKPFPGLSKDSFFERFSPELQSFVKVISSAPQALRDETDLVILTGGNSEWFWVRDILLGKETRFGDVGLKEIKDCPQKVIRMDQPAETVSRGLVYDRNILVVSPPKKEAVKQVPKQAPVKPAAPNVPIGDLTGFPPIPILRIGGYDSESKCQMIIVGHSANEPARGEKLFIFDGKKGRSDPEALKGTAVMKRRHSNAAETILYIQPEGQLDICSKDILVCTNSAHKDMAEPTKSINTNQHTSSTEALVQRNILASGLCGDSAHWTLYEDGELNIWGSGGTRDYGFRSLFSFKLNTPWFEYVDRITSITVSEGITRIGMCLLGDCYNVHSITLPDSLEMIGDLAIMDSNCAEIVIPKNVKEIGATAFSGCHIKEYIFIGDMPKMDSRLFKRGRSSAVEAHYPSDNPTWKQAEMMRFPCVSWIKY